MITEKSKPSRILRPTGVYAYTVESVEQVTGLPYYYLCSLADATHFVDPGQAFKHLPDQFVPMSLI